MDTLATMSMVPELPTNVLIGISLNHNCNQEYLPVPIAMQDNESMSFVAEAIEDG